MTEELVSDILLYMSQQDQALPASAIAKELGFPNAKSIDATLHKLFGRKLLSKSTKKRPHEWKITSKGRSQVAADQGEGDVSVETTGQTSVSACTAGQDEGDVSVATTGLADASVYACTADQGEGDVSVATTGLADASVSACTAGQDEVERSVDITGVVKDIPDQNMAELSDTKVASDQGIAEEDSCQSAADQLAADQVATNEVNHEDFSSITTDPLQTTVSGEESSLSSSTDQVTLKHQHDENEDTLRAGKRIRLDTNSPVTMDMEGPVSVDDVIQASGVSMELLDAGMSEMPVLDVDDIQMECSSSRIENVYGEDLDTAVTDLIKVEIGDHADAGQGLLQDSVEGNPHSGSHTEPATEVTNISQLASEGQLLDNGLSSDQQVLTDGKADLISSHVGVKLEHPESYYKPASLSDGNDYSLLRSGVKIESAISRNIAFSDSMQPDQHVSTSVKTETGDLREQDMNIHRADYPDREGMDRQDLEDWGDNVTTTPKFGEFEDDFLDDTESTDIMDDNVDIGGDPSHKMNKKKHLSLEPQNNLEKKIIAFLSSGMTKKLQEIMKMSGVTKKAEVNRPLYNLQKRNIITKVQDSPPVWQLKNQASLQDLSLEETMSTSSTNQDPAPAANREQVYPTGINRGSGHNRGGSLALSRPVTSRPTYGSTFGQGRGIPMSPMALLQMESAKTTPTLSLQKSAPNKTAAKAPVNTGADYIPFELNSSKPRAASLGRGRIIQRAVEEARAVKPQPPSFPVQPMSSGRSRGRSRGPHVSSTGGNFRPPPNPMDLMKSNTVFKNPNASGNDTKFTSDTPAQFGLAPGSHPGNRPQTMETKQISSSDRSIPSLLDFDFGKPKPLLSQLDSYSPNNASHQKKDALSMNPMDLLRSSMNTSKNTFPVVSQVAVTLSSDPLQSKLMGPIMSPNKLNKVNTSFKPSATSRITPSRASSIPASPASILGLTDSQHQNLVNAAKPQLRQPPLGVTASHAPGVPVNAPVLSNDAFAALNKNSVSALMEYAQARKSTATIEVIGQRGPPHNPKFKIAVFIGKHQFPAVECSNKKDGRKEAADLALRTLMASGQYTQEQKKQTPSFVSMVQSGKGTHFDRIAALSHGMYNQLAAQVAEMMAGRKVMAALIMQKGAGDQGTVISLGTGNRCITGQYMSLEGQTVNDSHAEIITRRGFIRFLYRELLQGQPGSPNSILEQGDGGRFKVKHGVTFHLYISTAPCGDGALFSPRDSHSGQMKCSEDHTEHDPIFTSKVQGVLRTKMEGGEGTIPIETGYRAQTWDGILRGERLRTMSCSDKVCRWNLVGMQGALLSHFIAPIYMDSLTLGLLYDHGHLSRAVCCRLSHGEPDISPALPPSYRVNHPRLGRVTMCDPPRETQKTKEYSFNWAEGDPKPEVLDGTKGICTGVRSLDEQVSRVSKTCLYRHFKATCIKYGEDSLLASQTYGEAKTNATDFQNVKQIMCKKFKTMGYGPWVSKPVEEEMFDITN